jgi:hypothetical protein
MNRNADFPPRTQPFWRRLAAPPVPQIGTALVLLLLYLFGVYHWIRFFRHGNLSFKAYDWEKEYTYLAVFQQALREGRLPFHISKGFHYTNQFLGLPETLLSPQVLLVPFLPVGQFIVANILLLYTVGCVGCLLIAHRYRLGLLPFTALFLLFHFNGYITAHLSVGHLMWSGYFLLPFFALYVLELVEERRAGRLTALKLAFVLFAMILQGAFHMVIWCWMFLGLLYLFNPRLWRAGLVVFGFSLALAFFRLLPAAVVFWNFKAYYFLSGYPSLTDLLDAFLVLRDHNGPIIGGFEGMGWWEYDLYIGVLGFAFLVYFGIYRRFDRDPDHARYRYEALDMPLALMAFLSVNHFYAFVAALPLPLFNSERAASRFIIIPVVLLMVIATIRLQRLLEKKASLKVNVLLIAALLQTLFCLAMHSYHWRLAPLEREFQWKQVDLQVSIIDQYDPVYKAAVSGSAAVSLAALVVWAWCFWRWRKPTNASTV